MATASRTLSSTPRSHGASQVLAWNGGLLNWLCVIVCMRYVGQLSAFLPLPDPRLGAHPPTCACLLPFHLYRDRKPRVRWAHFHDIEPLPEVGPFDTIPRWCHLCCRPTLASYARLASAQQADALTSNRHCPAASCMLPVTGSARSHAGFHGASPACCHQATLTSNACAAGAARRRGWAAAAPAGCGPAARPQRARAGQHVRQ